MIEYGFLLIAGVIMQYYHMDTLTYIYGLIIGVVFILLLLRKSIR